MGPVAAAVLAAVTVLSPVHSKELGRQVLAPDDGWAAAEGGTTGGAAAGHTVTVRTRDELAAAVAGDAPKIVYVEGAIDAGGRTCADYAVPEYSLRSYLDAYDPAHWTGPASGPLEEARKASAANQRKDVVIGIGANTTLVGRPGASLTGLALTVDKADNVIVRNLAVHDAYDCFPGWSGGDWKTEYDNISISGSRHVWVDHVTLTDGDHPDQAEPRYFGARFLHHDGLLDVVRGSDLVTISWSRFAGHDKSLLWGNTDNPQYDAGKLRITLHHNELTALNQRAPRVRHGQVHVYNNSYVVPPGSEYTYSWGVGVNSAIYAQNNTFRLPGGTTADKIIYRWGGTAIHEEGTLVNGRPVNVLAAYNAANDPDLGGDVGRRPHLHGRVDPGHAVPGLVQARAGAGRLS
ncbi:pectate lyase family protein [Nonomuraea sp. 10N515B]|uniref:pectate lyase family protein n=1 Tax=Nonomuraea sp. 10N515B TaxID=3457422 RepID=UPI003FCC491B